MPCQLRRLQPGVILIPPVRQDDAGHDGNNILAGTMPTAQHNISPLTSVPPDALLIRRVLWGDSRQEHAAAALAS